MTTTVDPDEVSIVRCGTSAGPIALRLNRKWSPHGYDRALHLFQSGFYDSSHFYRVVPHFLVQFGISYSASEELKKLANTPIPDDPQQNPPVQFVEGTISYAGSGDNSRTSQLFISYGRNAGLGQQKWETPIGQVLEGMENVNNFYSYGDMPPWGKGPVQGKIHSGRSYIEDNFPLTDRFLECTVVRGVVTDDGTAATSTSTDTGTATDEEDESSDDDEENESDVGEEKEEETRRDQLQKGDPLVVTAEPRVIHRAAQERPMVGDASNSSVPFVAAFGVLVLVAISIFALSGKMFRNKTTHNRKKS